jgi:tRNA dimethylallyltransferase
VPGRAADPAPTPIAGIIGPTGSGKTDLALALADRLPVEILVADSRQVVRGMDVGTAKPSAADRARVPHHLLDIVDPDEAFSVAQWVERARAVVAEIGQRGRIPMVVAGTGLYLSALIDGHDYAAQAWSPEVRGRLAAELETDGLDGLAARLRQLDPGGAAGTDLRNPRRVLRALERAEIGERIEAPSAAPYAGRVALIGLARPREVLYRRIDERAHRLFATGLLDEVRDLAARGFGPGLRPMTGHGYQEAGRHLAGEWSLDRAIEATAMRTRQYAKRQLTWYRRDARIMWIAAGDRDGDDPAIVARADQLVRAALS